MPPNEPKAHHFVQRAYLEGFCESKPNKRMRKPFLCVFSPGTSMRRQVPKECAVQTYFYCVERDGKRDFQIEKTIGDMETASSPVLEAVRQGKLPTTGTDRLTLAGYIALAMVRTPTAKKIVDKAYIDFQVDRFKAFVNTPGELEAYLQEQELKIGIKKDPEEERRKLKGGRIKGVQSNHAWSLKMMFSQLTVFQDEISKMHWTLLTSQSEFLTCDRPVSLSRPPNGKIGLRPGQVTLDLLFPISRQHCFAASYMPIDQYGKLDDDMTRHLNIDTIRRADRFVYSPFDAPYIQSELDEAHSRREANQDDSIQL